MKLEYFVVYENSSDEFDIGNCWTKVKVTAQLRIFSPFTAIQTIKFHNSTLVQARNLIFSVYVYLILIYSIYEYRHA